jgi:hypothetical protein
MRATSVTAICASAIPARAAVCATAINRRSGPLPWPGHEAYPAAHAKFALRTMHAHRLWIKLWITLGHPEENCNRPEGNARVTSAPRPEAHSHRSQSTATGHNPCAQSQRALAGRIVVIPGIHRPYDDYQSCNDRQIQIKVAKRPPRARCTRGRDPAPLAPRPLRAEPVTPDHR